MTKEFFKKVLKETLETCEHVIGVKAMEYVRDDNPMHNFEHGAKLEGKSREEVLVGFALKHVISIHDIRNDLKVGQLPTEELVSEKYGDAINYLILEKASILDRINEQNKNK